MKLKNGNYSLKGLQMAFLAAKLEKEESNNNRCPLCWENGCKSHSVDIKNDPFISLTTVEEFQYA